jgi:twitching motility protein PilT
MQPKILQIFAKAVELGVSDISIKPGSPPGFRRNGHLVVSEEESLVSQEMFDLLLPLLDIGHQEELKTRFQTVFMFPFRRKARIRCCLFQQREGFAGSFRVIPAQIPSVEQLHLPRELETQALRPHGLFLVVGPAGSGKSHTMAAMVNAINTRLPRHIITVESPIEFLHPRRQSIFTQIQIGPKMPTYRDALMNALREDPDVIQIGEMNDAHTVETALTASETGHFVISTLSTNGAVATLERILSFFGPEKQDEVRRQLAGNLSGIFSQLLIPRLSPDHPPALAYEVLLPTAGIRTLIRERKFTQIPSAMMMAKRDGCVVLKDSLTRLLQDETGDTALLKTLLQEIVE